MAHNPTHRRKLATPESPSISQTTTSKRQPNPSTTSTSTIYNLTNHFSKLHPNPKPKPKPKTQAQVHAQAHKVPKHIDSPLQNKSLVAVVEEDTVESKKEERESKKGGEGNKGIVVKPSNGTEKRRSFCDAKVELGNFLVTNCAKVVSADMPPFMQFMLLVFARKIKDSLEKFTSKNLALSLKKELDGVYGPAWHCIVGTSFGSFVTHSVGGFLYFSLDQKLYVLLFKTAVQRAD
ncbi:Dynein light chain cytoplasmic [Bienertia sinuspersici]